MFCCLYIAAYRFQIAGYRDVHEYRDVKQKEPVSATKLCVNFHIHVVGNFQVFESSISALYS